MEIRLLLFPKKVLDRRKFRKFSIRISKQLLHRNEPVRRLNTRDSILRILVDAEALLESDPKERKRQPNRTNLPITMPRVDKDIRRWNSFHLGRSSSRACGREGGQIGRNEHRANNMASARRNPNRYGPVSMQYAKVLLSPPPPLPPFLLLAENSLSVFLSPAVSLLLLLVLYNLRILGFGNLITVQCLHCSPSRPGNKLPIVAAQSFYLSRDLGVRHPCDVRHPRPRHLPFVPFDIDFSDSATTYVCMSLRVIELS